MSFLSKISRMLLQIVVISLCIHRKCVTKLRENRGHPLSTYVKFSEKLTFLTPRGLEMFVFRKMWRTYLMDVPIGYFKRCCSLEITQF